MTLAEHDVDRRIAAALHATAEAVAAGRFAGAEPAPPAVFELHELTPVRPPTRHRVQHGRLVLVGAVSSVLAGLALVIALLVGHLGHDPVPPGGQLPAPSTSSSVPSGPASNPSSSGYSGSSSGSNSSSKSGGHSGSNSNSHPASSGG